MVTVGLHFADAKVRRMDHMVPLVRREVEKPNPDTLFYVTIGWAFLWKNQSNKHHVPDVGVLFYFRVKYLLNLIRYMDTCWVFSGVDMIFVKF